MTLRATIEIVPFGDEERKEELYRLDISNVGIVRKLGFGNDICEYSVKVYRKSPSTLVTQYGFDEYTLELEDTIPQHNRRDGAVALVAKATKLVHGRC